MQQDLHGQGRLLELRVRAFCAALEQSHHLLFPVHRRLLFTLLFSTPGQSRELQRQNHKAHSSSSWPRLTAVRQFGESRGAKTEPHSSSSRPRLTAVRHFEEISKSLMHAAAVHALLLQVPI